MSGRWSGRDLRVRPRPGARIAFPDTTVAAGEVLAVTGPNGVGKSTLLAIVAGRRHPDTGHGHWAGPAAAPVVASWLGEDILFPELTVGDHLDLLRRTVPDAGDEPALRLRSWGLHGLDEAFPDELSSGQRQAVTLACLLCRPAELVVLDEPEARLDERVVSGVAAWIVDRAGAGAAVVVATHDPGLVAATGARELRLGAA